MKFKNWVSSSGLVENGLVENTNYSMPNSDATVTANYTAFASQPKFTKINRSSGNIDYVLNGEFIESERRVVKVGETAEDEFSYNHDFLSTPYEINEGTEKNQVPAGQYKIAVKHESKWYYSDIFTVNYDEQISENNTESNTNNNEVNNIGNNTESNMVSNTANNNTKLPQTGEETNIFANWLSIVILLGIFWLGSMILIDREKKKMTRK